MTATLAYRFGPFVLDQSSYRLTREGAPLSLSPRALDLLLWFVRQPDALLTKEDIFRVLWADVAVTDNALTQVVSELRHALSDAASSPAYIQTVARRGYRFIGHVDTIETTESPPAPSPSRVGGVSDTASLDAYRAATEGRLLLESLDPADISGALVSFTRALECDPDYALAHVGLAHARFWRYQSSRAANVPDRHELDLAIMHARRAVEIEPELAEGQAALALCLAGADRSREAVRAGRLAVAIEPTNWRHQFRLGMAAWGRERIDALSAVARLYPQLGYAHFGMAMVHVARRDLPAASRALEAGIAAERHTLPGPRRFPQNGLHWLAGLIALAEGDLARARTEFDTETRSSPGKLFAAEYITAAHDGLGFASLAAGDPKGALRSFDAALALFPEHARSLIGISVACEKAGHRDRAKTMAGRVTAAVAVLRASGRPIEAAMAEGLAYAATDRADACFNVLETLAETSVAPWAGWTIPIEPLLEPFRSTVRFGALCARLGERAL